MAGEDGQRLEVLVRVGAVALGHRDVEHAHGLAVVQERTRAQAQAKAEREGNYFAGGILDIVNWSGIADIGGGEFFRATDNQALISVFAKIDELEKAEIKETRYKDTADYYFVYLQWAASFFLLWLLLKSTFISNVLQD